jgi:nucleoside-diphosphate-sugar epimerase
MPSLQTGKDLECEIVNHESAVNIANLSKKNGVKIFIFQSSVSVYSRGENIDEEAPKDPLSTYGKTKMRAEKGLLEINSPEFKVVILRPATVVGYNPAFRYETIINLMCIRSLYKMPINIFESAMYGNKTYTYLKDNAAAIIFAIENANLMNGQYYNVSSFNVNLDTVLKILKRTLKEDFPYYMTPQKTISQHVYTVSSEKISKLGFKPEGNIEAVIQESIANLKKQRSFFHGMSGIY